MTEDVDQPLLDPIGCPLSNDLMRRNLASQGDNGAVLRETSHFCYPVRRWLMLCRRMR